MVRTKGLLAMESKFSLFGFDNRFIPGLPSSPCNPRSHVIVPTNKSGFQSSRRRQRPQSTAQSTFRPDGHLAPDLQTCCSLEWQGIVGRLEEISRSDSIVCFDWIVPDIFSMPKGPGAIYFGPEVEFGESLWYCGLYPKGELLGVELRRFSYNVDYFSLGIVKADGEEDVRLPKQMFPENCRLFYFDRFLSVSELQQRSPDLAPSNNLTIRCTLWTDVPCSDECRRSMSLDSSIEEEASPQADHRGRSISLDSKKPDVVMCAAKEEEVAQVQFVGFRSSTCNLRSHVIAPTNKSGRNYFSSDTLTNSRVTRSVVEEEWSVGEALGDPSNWYAPETGNIREEEKNLKKHVEWDVDFEFLKEHGHVKGLPFDFGEQNFFLDLCLYWQGDLEIRLYGQGPSCSSVYRCWGGLKYKDGTYPTKVRNLELDLREERYKEKSVASLGDFCEFDLESKYLNSKGCLTVFARLKADGDSSMGDGLTDACVQTDECERAAESLTDACVQTDECERAAESTIDGSVQIDGEVSGTINKDELPEDSESIERLRQLFKFWLDHPEEGENIRQICREDFRTSFKKT